MKNDDLLIMFMALSDEKSGKSGGCGTLVTLLMIAGLFFTCVALVVN